MRCRRRSATRWRSRGGTVVGSIVLRSAPARVHGRAAQRRQVDQGRRTAGGVHSRLRRRRHSAREAVADRAPGRRAARQQRLERSGRARAGVRRPRGRGLRRRLLPEQHASRDAGVRRRLSRRLRRRDAGDPRGAGVRRRHAGRAPAAEGARSRPQVAQALQRAAHHRGRRRRDRHPAAGHPAPALPAQVDNGTISEIAPGRIEQRAAAAPRRRRRGIRSPAPSTRTSRSEAPSVAARHGGPRDASGRALRAIGEFGLLARLLPTLPTGGRGVLLGPGDDCAVVAPRSARPAAHHRCAGRRRALPPRLALAAPSSAARRSRSTPATSRRWAARRAGAWCSIAAPPRLPAADVAAISRAPSPPPPGAPARPLVGGNLSRARELSVALALHRRGAARGR